MGLKEDYERKGQQNCPIHNHIPMLNGRICQLCRPNCIVLGLTRHEIQQKKNRNLNYVFYMVLIMQYHIITTIKKKKKKMNLNQCNMGEILHQVDSIFVKKRKKKQNVIIYCYIITLILKKV